MKTSSSTIRLFSRNFTSAAFDVEADVAGEVDVIVDVTVGLSSLVVDVDKRVPEASPLAAAADVLARSMASANFTAYKKLSQSLTEVVSFIIPKVNIRLTTSQV